MNAVRQILRFKVNLNRYDYRPTEKEIVKYQIVIYIWLTLVFNHCAFAETQNSIKFQGYKCSSLNSVAIMELPLRETFTLG